MAKPVKRKVSGGRTTSGGRHTPKGGVPAPAKGAGGKPAVKAPAGNAVTGPAPSSRYTPRTPSEYHVSPTWVPVLMFAFLIVGALVIIVNYTGAVWDTNNWYLIGGLTSILAGILVATQWH
jgi:hypothetical protein